MPPDHHASQGSGYDHNSWMGMGGYSQAGQQPNISPLHEYPGFDYNQNPMPMEPAYSMPRPPPYTATHPQLPPPLIMPQNAIWPSMLATQNHSANSYQTPLLPAAPLQTPVSAGAGSDVTPTSAKTSTSRRKLTNEERRQMCLEAEQNPTMKQTQIGAKFNVERSTVSKILRQRDKYINPPLKEEVTSPGKKSKAKLPDFEKTLTNWVRNQQKKGLPVTDEELRKQARVFSFSRSDQALLSSPSWLEKFKHKNNLHSGHKDRRYRAMSDEAEVGLIDSSTTSHIETPVDDSPISSSGLVSPPMSAADELIHSGIPQDESADEYFDFGGKEPFDHSSGLHHVLDADLERSLSDTGLSPISPELMRGETLDLEDDPVGHRLMQSGSSSSRQRSQTLPHITEHMGGSRPPSSGHSVAALPVRAMSSYVEQHRHTTAVDPRQTMKRHKSVPDIHEPEPVRFSSMQPPPLPRSADISPISNPGSPADDDNIRALHSIKKLLQQNPNVAEPDDYLAIGKLMEKLKVLRSPTITPVLPGGMHPVDILDSPRMSKKRTILGIST